MFLSLTYVNYWLDTLNYMTHSTIQIQIRKINLLKLLCGTIQQWNSSGNWVLLKGAPGRINGYFKFSLSQIIEIEVSKFKILPKKSHKHKVYWNWFFDLLSFEIQQLELIWNDLIFFSWEHNCLRHLYLVF